MGPEKISSCAISTSPKKLASLMVDGRRYRELLLRTSGSSLSSITAGEWLLGLEGMLT
jgi:hypothetical protein